MKMMLGVAAVVLVLSGCAQDTSDAQHRCNLSRFSMINIDPYLSDDQKLDKAVEIADQCAREAAEDPAAFNAHWQG